MKIIDIIAESNKITVGDRFELELDNDLIIESTIVGFMRDGIVIQGDDTVLSYLESEPIEESITNIESMLVSDLNEAEYQGRKVPLGKPMKGDVKKSKVYVKGPKGNVVKVNFGDKKLSIKKHIPGRRKSFRARHNCDNPGPRWKPRYWACRTW